MPHQKRPRDLSKDRITCPTCAGKGNIPNPEMIGATLAKERKAAGVSGKAIALRMDLSPGYISDVELGRRGITPPRIDEYRKALAAEIADKAKKTAK